MQRRRVPQSIRPLQRCPQSKRIHDKPALRTTRRKSNSNKKKKRTRKIIWFNPPFSKNVLTNVAKTFLQLVNKHFTRNHALHKIFNRNTLKASYSCMPNIANIIKAHNQKTLSQPTESNQTRSCNAENQRCAPSTDNA